MTRPIKETQDLAQTVANAIAKWKSENPDVILMDVIVNGRCVSAEACYKNGPAACQEATIDVVHLSN